MFENKAASFASALYGLALEEGKTKEYQDALKGVESSLVSNPALLETLKSYAIPKERLYALVDELWGKGLKSLAPFMKTVVKNHAVGFFREIVAKFSSLVNEGLGVEEGLAYSVYPLSKEEMAALEEAIGKALGKKAALRNRVDPAILGGVKVAIAGKVFDGSLERKLSDMRRSLLEGGIR
ncbi:MAG: ATP synthase F1 subunit delta [Bacilli bacterium]|jgi:F-type H+-transporting ATPase subunit delta|nr:ATP synthase F1 subunit delta [Bacilli bacterium]